MSRYVSKFVFSSIVLFILAAALALGLRAWHIQDVQFQFDEWLGGWHANPALSRGGSLTKFSILFWNNVRHYVTSGRRSPGRPWLRY